MLVLHCAPKALPRYVTRIGLLHPLLANCLNLPRHIRHILIIAHQDRPRLCGHRLGQALSLLHL